MMKKRRSRWDCSPWQDLPEDVLALILNKLHLTDQCRFRAVCKSWRVPEDRINPCPDLPWLIHYYEDSLPPFGPTYTLKYTLIDPYSKRLYHLSKPIHQDLNIFSLSPDLCYSKYGWSLFSNKVEYQSIFFLHNPFSKDDVIVLPPLFPGQNFTPLGEQAVFTTIPTCSDSEVLVRYTCRTPDLVRCVYICRYRLWSPDKEWTTQLLDSEPDDIPGHYSYANWYDLQHIDGKLHSITYRGTIPEPEFTTYGLEDNTWESANVPISDEEGVHLNWEDRFKDGCWLTVMGGTDLIMICKVNEPGFRWFQKVTWVIFRFDWLHRRWVLVKDLKNTVFFMSGSKIISHAPLEDNDDDCLIIHTDTFCKGLGDCGNVELNCYSFKQRTHVPVPEPYTWIVPLLQDLRSFYIIQPPKH